MATIATAGLADALRARWPQRRLGEFPSAVEHCRALGEAIGCPRLFAKRDDRARPGAPGNKLRALQWLWPELEREPGGAVAYGPAGSNWARTLLLVAREHAFPVDVHVFTYPGNADGVAGLQSVIGSARRYREHGDPVRLMLGLWWRRLFAARPRPRFLPAGGTTPLTVLAQVEAALELAAQVRDGMLPAPDLCYVAHGTGGTPAGLALGFKLAGLPTEVVGVRVATRLVANGPMARRWIRAGGRLLARAGLPAPAARDCALRIEGHFMGPGYGRPTEAGAEALRLAADLAGLPLDPTYTAKTMSAIVAHGRAGALRDKTVLFWHSYAPPGGGPAPASPSPVDR